MACYGDNVMRLRREVTTLKRQLGEKVTDNSDIFQPEPVGGKELERLQAEYASLTCRRATTEMERPAIRAKALRELEQMENDPGPPRKVAPKPASNADLYVNEEEFKRTGGG